MRKTVFIILNWRSFRILRYFDDRFIGPWYDQVSMIFQIFCNGQINDDDAVRQAYINHSESIKQLVPKERLLVFEQPYRWEPLCEFLGVQRPPGEYPVINDSDVFVGKAYRWRRLAALNSTKRIGKWVAAFAVVWIARHFLM